MGMLTSLARKATKTVVYTAVPGAGLIKVATVGTRNGNLKRKEMRQQTELLRQQNALLARQSGGDHMVTPDGIWETFDGGANWKRR